MWHNVIFLIELLSFFYFLINLNFIFCTLIDNFIQSSMYVFLFLEIMARLSILSIELKRYFILTDEKSKTMTTKWK